MQQNSRRRCDHQCKQHTFQIFSSNSSDYPSLDVDVIFCPKYHRPPKQPQTIFPTFNHDNKYYTSGFILQIDQKALTTNQSQILHQYNKHVKQATQKQGKIVFPKPSKRNNICGVCKEQYSNYFKHIMNQEHKLKLITNQYGRQLLQVSQKYQDLHPKSTPQYPIKIIKIDKKVDQQNLLALTEDETKEMRQQMLTNSKGVLRKEIQALIISSDDQKQQSLQEKCYYQRQHSSSNQQHLSSKISKNSKEDSNDSDSVQIVSVRPSKNKQKSNKNKKSNKNSKSKNKKHKSKSRKRQSKESKSSQESSQSQQASQKKRGSVGKKGPDLMPEVRKPLFKKKQGTTTLSKPIQVLIQKSQIQNPQLDDQMQKILNNIIGGIKNSPPAQPRRKYQKGIDVSDLRSSVIGGNALSAISLSQSKSVSNYRPNENKLPNTSSNQISQDKIYQYDKNIQLFQNKKSINKNSQQKLQSEQIQRPKDKQQAVHSRVAKPNPILAKLNLTNLSQKNKIGLATKKTINSNMKASTTKIQKCIDLDSEQIIQMSCRQKDKKRAELQLIMRYDQKKLSNKSTINQDGITNGIKPDENE